MSNPLDLLIVGGGPAGLSAAINAASEGLSVTLIDPGTIGGQARYSTAIENVPGWPNGITGQQLANRSLKQARKFGVRVLSDRVDTFVTHPDRMLSAQLSSARMIDTRSIILAAGLSPSPLSIPGATLPGVLPALNPSDLPRYAGKRVALVGGGNSAGQAALALAKHGANVHLFARHALTSSMSQYLIDRLLQFITLREDEPVNQIDPCPEGLRVNASDIFDAVISYVGFAPFHTFPVRTDPRAFIQAPSFETSTPGVFAIGDIRAGSVKRIATAIGEGSAVVPSIHAYLKGSQS